MKTPRRLASRTLVTAPHLTLDEHDIADGDALQATRKVHTVGLSDWCVVAASTEDERWVLVEQHRHGVDALTLEPAGGIVDAGEAPATAARRELVEETGFGGGDLIELGWVHPNPALSSNKAHLYWVLGVHAVAAPEQHIDELTKVVLLSSEEVSLALEDGRVTHALGVLALLRALSKQGARSAR